MNIYEQTFLLVRPWECLQTNGQKDGRTDGADNITLMADVRDKNLARSPKGSIDVSRGDLQPRHGQHETGKISCKKL